MRAVAATNPDLVVICSYPPNTVGMVNAINEIGFKPKMIGGAMVGLQATALKSQLGAALNGFVNFDFGCRCRTMHFPGRRRSSKNTRRAPARRGVDALGVLWRLGVFQFQVMAQAIEAAKSIDDKKLADFIRTNTFKTVLGDIKFGTDGEWAQSRVLQTQFHDIKAVM